jgi:CTP:molybdopterin cytidylyltransferase MocA
MSVAGIVLAAGEGTRFGGPKALARDGERSWLEIAIAVLLEGGCRPVVAVLGAAAEAARAGVREERLPAGPGAGESLPPPQVFWVVHSGWSRGRAGSLQQAIRALPPETTAVVVHAVDHPGVRPATIAALVAAAGVAPGSRIRVETGGGAPEILPPASAPSAIAGIAVPTQGGRRGHPVLLGRACWDEILRLEPDDPLRLVVRRDPGRVREVPVDDPAIHENRNVAAEAGDARSGGRGRTDR